MEWPLSDLRLSVGDVVHEPVGLQALEADDFAKLRT